MNKLFSKFSFFNVYYFVYIWMNVVETKTVRGESKNLDKSKVSKENCKYVHRFINALPIRTNKSWKSSWKRKIYFLLTGNFQGHKIESANFRHRCHFDEILWSISCLILKTWSLENQDYEFRMKNICSWKEFSLF